MPSAKGPRHTDIITNPHHFWYISAIWPSLRFSETATWPIWGNLQGTEVKFLTVVSLVYLVHFVCQQEENFKRVQTSRILLSDSRILSKNYMRMVLLKSSSPPSLNEAFFQNGLAWLDLYSARFDMHWIRSCALRKQNIIYTKLGLHRKNLSFATTRKSHKTRTYITSNSPTVATSVEIDHCRNASFDPEVTHK